MRCPSAARSLRCNRVCRCCPDGDHSPAECRAHGDCAPYGRKSCLELARLARPWAWDNRSIFIGLCPQNLRRRFQFHGGHDAADPHLGAVMRRHGAQFRTLSSGRGRSGPAETERLLARWASRARDLILQSPTPSPCPRRSLARRGSLHRNRTRSAVTGYRLPHPQNCLPVARRFFTPPACSHRFR